MSPETVIITPHAVRRYRQRLKCTMSDEKIKNRIRQRLSEATAVKMKPEFRVTALLSHGFKEAQYYKHGDLIIVIEDNVLKTVHNGTANRWE